jgi:hypothetical protein
MQLIPGCRRLTLKGGTTFLSLCSPENFPPGGKRVNMEIVGWFETEAENAPYRYL